MPALSRRTALLLLPALAGGCVTGSVVGGGDSMPPLDFSYLTPIRLNVATLDVDDRSARQPDSTGVPSPVPPAAALALMARQRLLPSGNAGRAVFVIDQAAVRRVPGGLDGTMAVHLDVLTTEGARAGFAEARVSRRRLGGDDGPAAAYDLIRRMMDDMNVEFEFQVRHSLRDWVQSTEPTEPPPAPVEAQPLPPPGTAAPEPPPPPEAPAAPLAPEPTD